MTPDAIPDLLAELDALVGLAPVKAGVERLVAIHQLNSVRVTAGKPIIAHDLDLMFTGDPGTGEDQVAALIGRLYAALGLLPAGQVVEVRRGDLVGATAEETQARVQAAVTAASGGVLFVDDAEQLIPLVPEDQGIVALAALAAAVDVRPVPFACIVSAPTDAIDAIAVHYPAFVYAHAAALEFPRYTADELVAIFERGAGALQIAVPKPVEAALLEHFVAVHDRGDFRSARYVPALLEEMYARLATRTMADGKADGNEHRRFAVADVPEPASAIAADTGIRIGFSGDLGVR